MENRAYTLVRSKRKTIAIMIRNNELQVRAPLNCSIQQIEAFLQQKESWISKHLVKKHELNINLERHSQLYFGRVMDVEWRDAKTMRIEIEDSIKVYGMKHQVSRLNRMLEREMIKRLEQIVISRAAYYSKLLNIDYREVALRTYRAAWGKCSNKKDLFFAKKLIFTADEFIDYVVLHECTHLIHFNHSKAFYQTIEYFMPDYKAVIQRNNQRMIISDEEESY